ncbi:MULTISPECIES: hypothetical protein [unclassified Polaribacter]|uniref:hypothetical protein n=1 Tax=unclassified Polaribacter TaxID=196858 RepID=UPI0011BF362F|nr:MULTISPECIES: hypothetical protein [unclassified Polaribacter]TXD51950.1 hypothetical protein ES043_10045 [Polaribacter sp. IC063]TXD59706.1 hypothetical protein ES044_09150 [Polaribacter sp. IC066]
MKNTQTYQIINGVLEINNSEIKIKYKKFKYGLEIFKFFAGVAFISSFIKKIENYKNLHKTYELVLFWFFGLASCILIYFFIRSIFKKVWTNTIELNDLIKIEIGYDLEKEIEIDEDSKIEITLLKNNGREKKIELKKENGQLENFLSEIKQRNTRIKIEHP